MTPAQVGPQNKQILRERMLAARREHPADRADGHRLAEAVMNTEQVRRADTIACYISVGTEPDTGPLIAAAHEAGKRVLVPLLNPDNDLDWAEWAGRDTLAAARRGLLEPTGPRLGVEAVRRAEVVVIPGVAGDRRGRRLGRGGGSYDRALARLDETAEVWLLLHPSEIVDEVPVEEHDRPVRRIVTAAGSTSCRSTS